MAFGKQVTVSGFRSPYGFGRFKTRPGRVRVMVGDSLTLGNVPSSGTYWRTWREGNDAFYTAKGLDPGTYINSGVGGSGAVYFENNIEDTINQYEPDEVYILLGINDVANLTLQQHVDLYNDGLDLIDGSPDLIICSPCLRQPGGDTSLDAEIRLMRDAQAQIARERGAVFIDMRANLDALSAAQRTAFTIDGIHPTEPAANATLSRWLSERVEPQE